jgi:DNA-binding beta-propeller fold protein YncE
MRLLHAALTISLGMLIFSCITESVPTTRTAPERMPGRVDDDTVLLPNQWSLRPAGRMIEVGNFPANMELSPDGHWLAVLHSGQGQHEVSIVDLTGRRPRVASRVPVTNFQGIAWAPDGERLFVSGGEDNVVHIYSHRGGLLGDHHEIPVAEGDDPMVGGLVVSPDAGTLYVILCIADRVLAVDLETEEISEIAAWENDVYPHSLLLEPGGEGLWVSLWGESAIERIDLTDPDAARERVAVGSHPNEMALTSDGARLFVACANDNTVHVVDTESQRATEVLNTALHPDSPEGSTPNSLAISPDGETLCVANADNNDVAVFDIEEPGHTRGEGFIPVGWYPTSVRLSADGERLFVANGKGDQGFANPQGPNPYHPSLTTVEYIGRLHPGTLTYLETPDEETLLSLTEDAYDCSPYRADLTPVVAPEGPNPIPQRVGDPSPITHVVYIVKENRTYDQVLGDMAEGNGEPSLCIFPERVSPNHHALAREFVLYDNFYVESEVSADGHEWSMAAYATDFVERTWPLNYSGRGFFYPAEGMHEIAVPDSGYIWDRCREAGVSYRSYGEFIRNGETPDDPGTARLESLEGHFDPQYRGYDLDYLDVDRAARFLEELERFEAEGEMPRFIVLRLPNDHTSGTREGRPTPTAYVGDNDLAMGQIIEGLSRSSFWPSLAIFVVEDDAQNGPDHVDAHRTVALIASPWAKRGLVDSHMYSTASMLRTMELILGLEPMSQFDAGARPMYASFTMEPDMTPYVCRPAQVDLDEVNTRDAWGAEISAGLYLEEEDSTDDILLNEIVWRSVRGADSPMPPPVRAAFLRPVDDDDEEEREGDEI